MPGITASVPSFCTQQCSWSAHPSVQQGGRLELPGRWRISGTVNHDHINKAALQRPLSSASVQKDPFLQNNVNFHPHRAIGMNSAAKGYFFAWISSWKPNSLQPAQHFSPEPEWTTTWFYSFHNRHSRKCPGLEPTTGILFLDKKKNPQGIFEQRSSPINSTGAKKFSQMVLFSFT